MCSVFSLSASIWLESGEQLVTGACFPLKDTGFFKFIGITRICLYLVENISIFKVLLSVVKVQNNINCLFFTLFVL